MLRRRIGGCLVAEYQRRNQGRQAETGTSEQEQGGGPAAALGSRPDQSGGLMAKEARVFRAKSRKWVNLVAGLLLSASSATNVAWADPVPATPTPITRTAPASVVLSKAIESQRHGDYETAAPLFDEASQRKAELKPNEQEDLTRCMDENTRAMNARREGMDLLTQAEKATKEGRTIDAAMALKRLVVVEQYLAPADKVRFQALNKTAPAKTVAPVDPNKESRISLQLGRAQFALYEFEAAEALAKEAMGQGGKFATNEDSPQKLLADIARARSDSSMMLKASRVMMQHREYDRAEYYAHQAEKTASSFSFSMWGDSPSKVLKEIQVARAEQPAPAKNMVAAKPATTAPAADAKTADQTGVRTVANQTPAAPPLASDTDGARVLLVKARLALKDGKFDEARRLTEEARAKRPVLAFDEDTPEKVAAAINAAQPKSQVVAVKPVKPAEKPANAYTKPEAVALLLDGRNLLAAKKFEEAANIAGKVKAMPLSWGLFEDSPDKLLQEVAHVRAKHDQEESIVVLAEARKALQKNDLETATKLAYRAQKLHGSYTVWDFGDRPQTVLNEIEAIKLKQRRGEAVVGNKTINEITKPEDKARAMLVEAKQAVAKGDTDKAKVIIDQVKQMHVRLEKPGEITPESLEREIAMGAKLKSVTAPGQLAATTPATGDKKQQALQLLSEARQLSQTDLVGARAKVLEARKLGVAFGPGEEGPEVFGQRLTVMVQKKVDSQVRQAMEGCQGPGDPVARYEQVEKNLLVARKLAFDFGFDTQPVDLQVEYVRQQRNTALAMSGGRAPVVLPVPGPSTGAAPEVVLTAEMNPQGVDLLNKARLEIKSNNLTLARKMAESVMSGNYGMANEAQAVLRTIDLEEFKQNQLTANRTFDAAVQAYNRGDFNNATIILSNVDSTLLDGSRKERLGQIQMTPQMQPSARTQVVQVTNQDPNAQTLPLPLPLPGDNVGRANASDKAGPALVTPLDAGSANATDMGLAKTSPMRDVLFQKLRKEGLTAQKDASDRFRTGDPDGALDILQAYERTVDDSVLDQGQMATLKRPIESRMASIKVLRESQVMAKNDHDAHMAATMQPLNKQRAEETKQKHVAELMKQFDTLYKECKYRDAEKVAVQAHEFDPDNPVITAAVTISKNQVNLMASKNAKESRADYNFNVLTSVETQVNSRVEEQVMHFDDKRWTQARGRKDPALANVVLKNEREREIQRKLSQPISLSFSNVPLAKVLDDIRAWHNINIYVDERALNAEGIDLNMPITIKLDQVALKSALNLILNTGSLTHVIKDEVLQITTQTAARGKLETKSYLVTDLVIPVRDFGDVHAPQNMIGAPMGGLQTEGNAATPYLTGTTPLMGGQGVGSPSGPNGSATLHQDMKPSYSDSETQEQKLINLIISTINPMSWQEMGGPGTINYFPLGKTLVINQTSDIQGEIADLLAALRKLQEQEVSVEVRFITVSEDFFERIGVNFNMNITTNANSNYGSQILSGVFQQGGVLNNFQPKNLLTGLTPAGTLTSDLNIPVSNNTFFGSAPLFGGYPGQGAGGLSLGLAFLSDIQVFLFLEASQGNTRTNVMQAPKLTLYNGQTATLTALDSQFFVSSVSIQIAPNGNPIFVPTQQQFPTAGTNLTLQAVISADRRFVRLSLNPTLTNIVPGGTTLFPIVVPVFGSQSSPNSSTPTVMLTQFLQQPTTSNLSVATTVSVPDGGTVLLGGLKRLSEARSEYGPPILSNIPIISRLFKNTGYGRETESLLIMVTPRIIVQSEEEEIQTGYVANQ